VKTLAEQLHAALKAKNWSVPQLLKAARWRIDRTSLQRKLSGTQKLSTEEAQELAEILGCTLVWVPDEAEAS
jgi:hypothetical protein